MSKANTRLNVYLKEKRIQSGLSQAEVATQLGYSSPQFISNWERGLVNPPLSALATLVELYKMTKTEVVEIYLDDTRKEIEGVLRPKRVAKKVKSATRYQ